MAKLAIIIIIIGLLLCGIGAGMYFWFRTTPLTGVCNFTSTGSGKPFQTQALVGTWMEVITQSDSLQINYCNAQDTKCGLTEKVAVCLPTYTKLNPIQADYSSNFESIHLSDGTVIGPNQGFNRLPYGGNYVYGIVSV